VLRRFKLHGQKVTLPNLSTFTYGQYKLRCCETCNSLLGKEVEVPVAKLFNGHLDGLASGLSAPNNCLLYQWLCLLFIKTHLKDRDLRTDRDPRNQSPLISDLYEWEGLHHIHTVARAAQSKSVIDPTVQGTILIFEMGSDSELFDYEDVYDHSTIFIRIGNAGVVAVLNDGGAAGYGLAGFLSGITGPLSNIQLREIAARAAYGNELLLSRPTFLTEFHHGADLFMKAALPDVLRFGKVDPAALGALLKHFCEPRIRRSSTSNKEEVIARLGRAQATFIYDDDGAFMDSSMPLPAQDGK
jgi:hypothetical protein